MYMYMYLWWKERFMIYLYMYITLSLSLSFCLSFFVSFFLSLLQVVRLTEEPYSPARTGLKNPIPADRVKTWLIENKVLSIAFGGLPKTLEIDF